jgi:probable HAF family extracellular repeat protein
MSMNYSLPIPFTLRMKLFLLTAALAVFTAVGWSQEYTLTDLGTLGGSTSWASAVNDSGQVVGAAYFKGDSHTDPFLYYNGTMTDLWPGTKLGADAVAISNSGHYVVNYGLNANGTNESYLWLGNAWVDLGTGDAVAINSSDTVIGNGLNGTGDGSYWTFSNGQLSYLPTSEFPPNIVEITAWNINDYGLIAAACQEPEEEAGGCVLGGATPVYLQNFTQNQPYGLNSDGAVCNQSEYNLAAYWSPDGALAQEFPFKGELSFCDALDNFGVGVGAAQVNGIPYSITNALIFDSLNGARDLNQLIPKPSISNYSLKVMQGVSISNNAGYIAAQCLRTSFVRGGKSEMHACLLTPRWSWILGGNIGSLIKKFPHCRQCAELEPEAKSLPKSLDDLSKAEKNKVAEIVAKIELQVGDLNSDTHVTEADKILLLHDSQMVLAAIGRGLPDPER